MELKGAEWVTQGEAEKVQLAWNEGIKQNRIIKIIEYIPNHVSLWVKGDIEYRKIL